MGDDTINPYAPPQTLPAQDPRLAGGVHGWRLEGDRLVARKGAVLPPICVWSGEPTQGLRIHRKITWAPPWIAACALVSPIVLIIVYLIVRKSGELDFALGEAARKRRKTSILWALGGAAAGVGLFVAGVVLEEPLLAVVAVFVLLVAMVAAAVLGRAIRPLKIDKEFIHLKLPPPAAAAFARAFSEH